MKRLFLFTAAAVGLLIAAYFTGCTASQNQTEAPKTGQKSKPGDYFPLTKGSSWQYLGDGNEYASFTREVLYTKDNRAQITEDNGGTVSNAVFEISDSEITRVYFEGEAYDKYNVLEKQSEQTVVILKEPLKTGTKWETDKSAREIVDVNATVDTPAGKFENCIKVKISNEDSVMYEYFKEGVGMVKREFISGDTRVTSTLEKYSIK